MLKQLYTTPSNRNYLSGYYDANTFTQDGSAFLASEVNENFSFPDFGQLVGLDLISFKTGNISRIYETHCFNFQQASKASFLYASLEESVLVNDFINNEYRTVIIDKSGNIMSELPVAYYSISADESCIVSLDFRRHDLFKRGYSYGYFKDHSCLAHPSHDSGLNIFSFPDMKQLANISLASLQTYIKGLDNQYFDHPMVSPNGSKVAFYHRLRTYKGLKTYLYIYNIAQSTLNLIGDFQRATHFNWLDDNTVVGWGSNGTLFTKFRDALPSSLLKQFLRIYKSLSNANSEVGNTNVSMAISGDQYLSINTQTLKVSPLFVGSTQLRSDGHPSFSPTRPQTMITDTYPNLSNCLSLLVVDMLSSSVTAKAVHKHEPLATRTPFRADLHPKVSRYSDLISVDIFDGHRSVVLYSY